jgi:hypothetical protein
MRKNIPKTFEEFIDNLYICCRCGSLSYKYDEIIFTPLTKEEWCDGKRIRQFTKFCKCGNEIVKFIEYMMD